MFSKSTKNRSGFTMVELIFVIIILGVVSSIGSEIIVRVYDAYLTQRATYRSNIKTELAAVQLVNRLERSVPGTIIGRLDDSSFAGIDNLPANEERMLEWIGYDADGFESMTSADRRPTWSGYADMNKSSKDTIFTAGSRVSDIDNIIKKLSNNNSGIADAAIFFPRKYFAHTIGYSETVRKTNGVNNVASATGSTITLTSIAATQTRDMSEHYKLSWSAYALKAGTPYTMPGLTGDVYDLELYYDYQPWKGETYSSGKKVTLIRNVSVFKFTGTVNSIRFKICQRENIGGFSINSCKEKAVIR